MSSSDPRVAKCDNRHRDTFIAEGTLTATVPSLVPVTTHGHLSELDVSSWCQH